MALFNYATKEITLKVVYYGPGLCGKTTNLQYLHEAMSPEKKGKLLSLSTDADRTLFFDFMPIQLGKIKGFNIRFQLYTVPGQVRYNATRKLVLKGADAIVFVADSQTAMKDANVESLQNMKENLIANNIKPEEIPLVLQYNKRDLENIMPVDELSATINPAGDEIIEAAAVNGTGVYETFQLITKRLLKFISKKHNVQIDVPEEMERKPAAAAPQPTAQPGKEKVQISVRDKTSDMLEDMPLGAIEEDILQTSVPESQAEEETPSAYEAMQLDTESFGGGWEPGPLEVEEAVEEQKPEAVEVSLAEEPIDMEMPEGGESLLEKMLAEEEGKNIGGGFPGGGPATSSIAPGTGGDVSGLISTLLQEFRNAKEKQQELARSLVAIEQIIAEISSKTGNG